MRAWIILSTITIATAIRPELNQPHGMDKAQFVLLMIFFFVGLSMDIVEFIKRLSGATTAKGGGNE